MTIGFQRVLRFTSLAALLFVSSMAMAQGWSIHGQAVNSTGKPAAYATVRTCPYVGGGGLPCNPLSSAYSDAALTEPVSNPYTTDQYGNYSFFVASSATYIVQVNVGSTTGGTYSYLITAGGSGGGGSPTPPNYAIQYYNPGGTFGGSAATITAAGAIDAPISVTTPQATLNGTNCTAFTAASSCLYLPTIHNSTGPNGTAFIGPVYQSSNVTGSGNNYSGIWSTVQGATLNTTCAQGGICQTLNTAVNCQFVGDCAGYTLIVHDDGGITAGSAQGINGLYTGIFENPSYHTGTLPVSSTTGSQNPTLSAPTNNTQKWTTVGADLINLNQTTNPGINGNLNGNETAWNGTFLYYAPVTISAGPTTITSAWCIATSNINNGVTASTATPPNAPTSSTITCAPQTRPGAGDSTPPLMAANVLTCVVGAQGTGNNQGSFERLFLSAVSGNTSSQTLTGAFRSFGNTSAAGLILMQGGPCGNDISFDANYQPPNVRTLQYEVGLFNVSGTYQLVGAIYVAGAYAGFGPRGASTSEPATYSGANSGFHSYAACTVVASGAQGSVPNPTCEPNKIVWSAGDQYENPHYAYFGGIGIQYNWTNYSTISPSYGAQMLGLTANGTGVASTRFTFLNITNGQPYSFYSFDGQPGLVTPPRAMFFDGPMDDAFYFFHAPYNGILNILCAYNCDSTLETKIVQTPSGKNFGFNWATGNYQFDNSNLSMLGNILNPSSASTIGTAVAPWGAMYTQNSFAAAFLPLAGTSQPLVGSSGNPFYASFINYMYIPSLGTSSAPLCTSAGYVVNTGCSSGGSGTVNSGTQYHIGIYATTGTAMSSDSLLTDNGSVLSYTGATGLTLTGALTTAGINGGTGAQTWNLYSNTEGWIPGGAGEVEQFTGSSGSHAWGQLVSSIFTPWALLNSAGLSIYGSSGVGGGDQYTEGTSTAGTSGIDTVWASSSAHCLELNNNNGGANCIVTQNGAFVGTNISTLAGGTATNVTNYGSFPFEFNYSYWNGTAATPGYWTATVNTGTGTNPGTVLAFTNTGSSGAAGVSVPAIQTGSINQTASNSTGGTCSMSTSTTCTVTISHTYTTPVCIPAQQSGTLTGGSVGCTVSGATATVTAATANSEVWGVLVFGNPN